MSPIPYIGVDVAILQGGRVLLTRREDFDVWCLPGGAVSPGETLAQAAVREVREEIGIDIELVSLVGVYSFPNWHRGGSHIVTFAAKSLGDRIRIQHDEVVQADYFSRTGMPDALLMGVRQRIEDAMAGFGGGVAGYTPGDWPFSPDLNRESIYRMRDQSALSRQEFYHRYFVDRRQNLGLIQEVPPNGRSVVVPPLGAPPQGKGTRLNHSGVGMPIIGAGVAVRKNGKLLLTRREDFEVWCLPGGAVEEGESVAGAAVREVAEETGLKVELDRLVGIYSEPNWFNHGLHVVLFAGRAVGGVQRPQPAEVVEIEFFNVKELPEDTIVGHQERMQHALEGVGGGVVRSQFKQWPLRPGITNQEIYALRDASGMGRREFYLNTFSECDGEEKRLEVGL